MAIFTINQINGVDKTITEDESAGLQTIATPPTSTEDNNDNDVTALSTSTASNPISISTELSNALTADGITAPTAIGYAEVDAFATISATGTIDVFFSAGKDANGVPLPINGVDSGLKTDAGDSILLYSSKDNNVVYGRAGSSTGALVFAIVLHETKTNGVTTGADIGIVQYQAISNPIAGGPGTTNGVINHDDAVDLTNKLFVSVSSVTVFSDFSTAPSGQDVWAGIRPPAEKTAQNSPLDLLVTGGNPNNGETVNVSTTGLGTNSQAVDPNELLRIDFVNNVFIATSSQAHTQTTLAYGTHIVSRGAGWSPVQVNPGSPNARVNATMTAYDAAGDFQGSLYFTHILDQSEVKITSVQVLGKDGTTDLGTRTADGTFAGDNNLSVKFIGNSVEVDGLLSDYRVVFHTSADMDRFTIQNVSAKNTFDVGRIANLGAAAETVEVGSHVRFEDDGPTISGTITNAPTLTVDETNLATDATESFAAQFTKGFGADGAAASGSTTYAVSTAGGMSTLTDTASGNPVFLFLESGTVVGRAGTDATAALSGPIVFVVSVDGSGNVKLDQQRAIVHPDTTNPDDSKSLAGTNLVQLTSTVKDGDGDTNSATIDITTLLTFKDDGPAISGDITKAPKLTVDETNLATDDTEAFAAAFTKSFGADGAAPSGSDTYALGTSGGNSGLTDTATKNPVFLFLESGQVVGRAGINATTAASGPIVFVVSVDGSGNVKLDQQRAIVQDSAPNTPDDSISMTTANLVTLTEKVIDGDGDIKSATLNIASLLVFKDDGPSIVVNATAKPTLPTTDPLAPATNSANGNFGVDFTPTYGADGQGATPLSYALSLGSTSSGLTDSLSGQAVVLSVSADGSLVTGKTQTSSLTVFTVGVDGTGKVTLTQNRAVVQGTGENGDIGETVGLTGSNIVVLKATATDGDGDQATATLDLTPQLSFKDVGPAITVGNIANGTYAAGGSSTWSETPNADGFKSLNVTLNNYTIDSHSQVTVNSSLGTDTITDANGNYGFNGTINADFNGDGTSDTVSFKLTFDPVGNTYKIDVTTPPETMQRGDPTQCRR
jgi:uridine phosphorylase